MVRVIALNGAITDGIILFYYLTGTILNRAYQLDTIHTVIIVTRRTVIAIK